MRPFWMSAFLDFAPGGFDEGLRFWSEVTGYATSPPRGDNGEFVTLQPPDGHDFLRAQRLDDGPDRIHIDLHVPHPRAAADQAIALGATEDMDMGYVVMRSPGGLTFCFVSLPARSRPNPTTWPGGHISMLDQVCIDIPRLGLESERSFWERVTGWVLRQDDDGSEFSSLDRPFGQPLRVLFQRLEEEDGRPVGAHLDWATDDRPAETSRHEAAGATVVDVRDEWTVLTDPNGRRYCITDRNPETGLQAREH